MVSADLGIKLENVTMDMFGRAKKVMVDRENTTIVSGAGKKTNMPAQFVDLKRSRASSRIPHSGVL